VRLSRGELIHSNHASCVVGSLEPSPSTDGLGGIKRGNAEKHTLTSYAVSLKEIVYLHLGNLSESVAFLMFVS
jgi:hypothetical protein